MVRAGSDMCLDLFHLLQGFLVYALLKKAEEAAAVAVARAGAAVMVSTRGGGGEGMMMMILVFRDLVYGYTRSDYTPFFGTL